MLGRVPNRIDVLTDITGIDWEASWVRRVKTEYAGVPIALLSIEDLIAAKRAAGRPQDIVDADKLQQIVGRRC